MLIETYLKNDRAKFCSIIFLSFLYFPLLWIKKIVRLYVPRQILSAAPDDTIYNMPFSGTGGTNAIPFAFTMPKYAPAARRQQRAKALFFMFFLR